MSNCNQNSKCPWSPLAQCSNEGPQNDPRDNNDFMPVSCTHVALNSPKWPVALWLLSTAIHNWTVLHGAIFSKKKLLMSSLVESSLPKAGAIFWFDAIWPALEAPLKWGCLTDWIHTWRLSGDSPWSQRGPVNAVCLESLDLWQELRNSRISAGLGRKYHWDTRVGAYSCVWLGPANCPVTNDSFCVCSVYVVCVCEAGGTPEVVVWRSEGSGTTHKTCLLQKPIIVWIVSQAGKKFKIPGATPLAKPNLSVLNKHSFLVCCWITLSFFLQHMCCTGLPCWHDFSESAQRTKTVTVSCDTSESAYLQVWSGKVALFTQNNGQHANKSSHRPFVHDQFSFNLWSCPATQLVTSNCHWISEASLQNMHFCAPPACAA